MKTAEELKALKEELETLKEKLAELSEEELKQVSGGGPWPDPPGWRTDMMCQNSYCRYFTHWDGHFLNQIFDCPQCNNHTLKGVREWN